jgi:hypothetical protein
VDQRGVLVPALALHNDLLSIVQPPLAAKLVFALALAM